MRSDRSTVQNWSPYIGTTAQCLHAVSGNLIMSLGYVLKSQGFFIYTTVSVMFCHRHFDKDICSISWKKLRRKQKSLSSEELLTLKVKQPFPKHCFWDVCAGVGEVDERLQSRSLTYFTCFISAQTGQGYSSDPDGLSQVQPYSDSVWSGLLKMNGLWLTDPTLTERLVAVKTHVITLNIQ